MRRSLVTASLFLGAIPGIANASSAIGTQSSGTVTITVDIPPISAALRAQAEGAVGLWTVTDSTSSLMIKLPDSVGVADPATAAIYHGSNVQFDVSVESPRVQIAAKAPEAMNGMTRESFGLEAKSLAGGVADNSSETAAGPVTFLVTAL